MGDVIRTVAVLLATTTYVLAVANLIVSYKVLSPKGASWRTFLGSGAGFLFAHIIFVTIPFQGFVTWGIVEVVFRAGDAITWRSPLLAALSGIMAVGYVIIFRVELARLRMKDLIQP